MGIMSDIVTLCDTKGNYSTFRINGLKEALNNANNGTSSSVISIADTKGNFSTVRIQGLKDALKGKDGSTTTATTSSTNSTVRDPILAMVGWTVGLFIGPLLIHPIFWLITGPVVIYSYWGWGRSWVDSSKHSKSGTFWRATGISFIYVLSIFILLPLFKDLTGLGFNSFGWFLIGTVWAIWRGLKTEFP